MKRIFDFFSSMRTMAVLLALFFISIAVATFIENDFGTPSARRLVYNAKWFELLLFAGMINLVLVIFKHKIYNKPTLFIFHIAFILIIMGAGITRFIGFEGTMPIREGTESSAITTTQNYLTISADFGNHTENFIKPISFSELGPNKLKKSFHFNDESVVVRLKEYLSSAEVTIEPDGQGKPIAEIVFQGWNPVFIKKGDVVSVGNLRIAFESDEKADILLNMHDNLLYFKAGFPVPVTNMSDQSTRMIPKDSTALFTPLTVHNFNNQLAVLRKFLPNGKITALKTSDSENKQPITEALRLEIESGSNIEEMILFKNKDDVGKEKSISIDNKIITIAYGMKKVQVPFSIYLNDFILERYPGSNSPSWYESKVTVHDKDNEFSKRIYMNNTLKYRGYRFYQASYDADEQGTILSVNYDWAGTLVTYIGYLCMALGMILSIFNRKSRFMRLIRESGEISKSKKLIIGFLVLFIPLIQSVKAVDTPLPTIDVKHAESFGKLLIQDNGGRIKPINSHSSEILRKITRKTMYKGLNSDQVLLGMMLDPEAWQNEPIIKVGHEKISELLESKEKRLPFIQFFSKNDQSYLLSSYVNEANMKKPAYRSKFDTEVIRADERLNVFYMTFTGSMLKIFPSVNEDNDTWYSPVDVYGNFNSEDSVFAYNIIPLYLQTLKQSVKTGNYKDADDLLNAMMAFQKRYGKKISPSAFKVNLEILYNRYNILDRLSSLYGVIGFILLILQFTGVFYSKLNLKGAVRSATVLILILFLFHTIALASRWYVSGHAPWSNGYESLTYIAWATVLAGIIFASRSAVTLSTTAVLAFLILHTAHLSWMDPEITNLVPVLKSYWLIIHVAVITASYGFLAMGAILAAVNLIIMFLETSSLKQKVDLTINELTIIIEMTLIIGLYLLSIGTFLGGVWANESWGRYWGWDPKETWALATVILYAFIAHMRLVPGLKSKFLFNLLALLGFGSVIMTYFGVNYYLSGLHSYAKGDRFPIPMFVYYSLASVFIVALLAWFNQRKINNAAA